MKCLLTALLVAISAITMAHPASANKVSVSPANTRHGQASDLATQPVTINSAAGNVGNRADRLKQITNSIPAEHGRASRSVNPLDFFKDPVTSFNQFAQEKRQTPQSVDPLQFFKVPPLPSSVGVPVTHF